MAGDIFSIPVHFLIDSITKTSSIDSIIMMPATASFSLMARRMTSSQFGVLGSFSSTQVTMLPLFQPCQESGQTRYRSNRSRRGLYDGKDIRSGNTLSFSMKANKRKFKPNVFLKKVYSETLDEMIRFHLTTSALRSIDKAGGLDNYLLKSKHVQEGEGMIAKERILKKLREEEREQQQQS